MQPPRPTRAAALVQTRTRWTGWLIGALMLAGAALAAGQVRADDAGIVTSYGYSKYGELKYPADFKHLDYVNPDAPKGGEYSTWAQGTFDSMNPYSREGRAGALATIGYESLMTGTADEVSATYCLICSTIEYPADKSWILFHMRPEVKFSDGTPLTANDVKFSFDILADQGLPSYADIVKSLIDKVEVIDDHTVKFWVKAGASPDDAFDVAGGTPIFEKAWFDKTGARLDESRFDIPPGSGPYMLDSYDVNKRIIYKRNPDYWGKDLPINIGRDNYDTIRVEYFADTTAAFEAFKAGEFTFRQENSSLSWATGYDFPALSKGWVVKATLPNGNLPGAYGMVFNLREPKFQDIRVRKALALMYNFSWTNDTLQYGLFDQRESFWQNSDLQAKGVPEGKELEYLQSVKDMIDPAILTDPVTEPHTSKADNPLDRSNLRKALALMEEAGWTVNDKGVLSKDGQPFTLEFLSDNPAFQRVLTPYIDNLKKLGVDAQFTIVDPAQYTNRTRAFQYDMIYDGYSNSLEEGLGLQQRYGSQGVNDVFNPSGYSSPAVDKLIQDVVAAKSYEDMAAAVRAIDRIMRADLFEIPAWYLASYWVAYYDFYEHPDNLPPYSLGQMDFWWVNADKAASLKAEGAYK
ncbi:MAG: ABC transporter substrate-binding protein [Limimaricola sp.]|uniref:extracellular solute-binding protein n=1 Tax=Limimaricola sp. TaxID=2211665 RepID=UPI001DE4589B|nr:extracellular solute-binding protein [Limimaricola sp.]MBI1417469.1 ABC transporter substrate-binding protein [Limimaricola sp.]